MFASVAICLLLNTFTLNLGILLLSFLFRHDFAVFEFPVLAPRFVQENVFFAFFVIFLATPKPFVLRNLISVQCTRSLLQFHLRKTLLPLLQSLSCHILCILHFTKFFFGTLKCFSISETCQRSARRSLSSTSVELLTTGCVIL